jgi:hypothetical protein
MIALACIALISFTFSFCLFGFWIGQYSELSLKRVFWSGCATLFIVGISATLWGVRTFRNPVTGAYFLNLRSLVTFAIAPAVVGSALAIGLLILLKAYGDRD